MGITEYRLAAGLSQRELAERCHVVQSCLCEIEHGKRRPWPKLARKLARVLKVPVAELLGDSDAKTAG
ncbi:MAG: helix-turn-helix transcriptional regulator [Chloroflexi bacterium]|nr:helix-turn-helix transcriptional regulator [Chloroflexota bacterium]